MGSRVNVLVRLRPVNKKEDNDNMPGRCARKMSGTKLELWNYRNGDVLEYDFDKVFDENAPQGTIYDNVKSILPNVLNGQNATVFGYGPTGAGKTHTIVGTKEKPGLIPRCINYIFKLIKSIEQQGKDGFKIYFSMLEIYQEKLYDLLVSKPKDMAIRQDSNGNIVIPELAEVQLESFSHFTEKYQAASNKRTIGATKLNNVSSRSHTIVLVKVVKTNCDNPTKKYVGKLYLIDLAGSEDNRRTGNTGIRLKESGAINSSLFALSMVVDALNKGMQRIPYRDSKLTRLLQDSIGGTAHALMIACIAPEPSCYWDTLNTLKFAAKSREIVNKPFTRVEDIRPLKRQLERDGAADMRAKKQMLDTQKDEKERNKENENLTIVHDVKNLLSPIKKRQEAFQSSVIDRLKALEEQLRSNMNADKSAPTRLPLSTSSKTNVPVSRVRPLMAKSQPALCKTPSAATDVILLDTPSPDCMQMETSTVDAIPTEKISLPDMIKNSTASCDSPRYKITLDPKVHEACESKIIATLNDGSLKQIMALPTIGKKRAQCIIEYRESNGSFSSLSDLLQAGFSKGMLQTFRKRNILQRLVIS